MSENKLSRREFFRRSALASVPLIGASLLLSHPVLAKAVRLTTSDAWDDHYLGLPKEAVDDSFTERVHAYIAGRYYVRLIQRYGEETGTDSFMFATRVYAEQRGRRMAQRAIRDGQPLTYLTYMRYSEWCNTEAMKSAGLENRSEVVNFDPYEVHIFQCPWNAQFRAMGLPQGGIAYCRYLDASIVKGFNPHIQFETLQTLHDHDHCVQRVQVKIDPKADRSKIPVMQRPFEYHCGHSYWSFRETITAIYGKEGQEIAEKVLNDFLTDYGQSMTERLKSYRETNFNVI